MSKKDEALRMALDAIRSTEAYKYGSVMLNEAAEMLEEALVEQPAEQPAEQQGPVAWMMVNPTHLPHSMSLCWQPQNWHVTWEAVPLYTAPQPARKPWVGLTSADRVEILSADGEAAVMLLTEAKLKERNT